MISTSAVFSSSFGNLAGKALMFLRIGLSNDNDTFAVPIKGMRRVAQQRKTPIKKLVSLTGFGVVLSLSMALSPFERDHLFSIEDPFRGIRGALALVSSNAIEEPSVERETHIQFVSQVIGKANRNADNLKLAKAIVAEAVKADLDPLFVAAIVKSESTFKTSAVSHRGAKGLMQLMPTTAEYTRDKIARGQIEHPRTNLHHVNYNLALGIAYLKHLQNIFKGNRELALIAYNWGPSNLVNALKTNAGIPGKTREYARKILKNHTMWKQEMRINAALAKNSSDNRLG